MGTNMPNTETATSTALPLPPSDRVQREHKLQADIDLLKDPSPFRKKFTTETAQQLAPAIEILRRLQVEAFEDASRVGFETLRSAKFHLDNALKNYLVSEA
jgi:hypothetical protein